MGLTWKNRYIGHKRTRPPPCMRWRGPRLASPLPGDRLPSLPALRAARRCQVPASVTGFPAPSAFRSFLRMVPVSNGGVFLSPQAMVAQESAGIHFRFFLRPHDVHRKASVVHRIIHSSSTGCLPQFRDAIRQSQLVSVSKPGRASGRHGPDQAPGRRGGMLVRLTPGCGRPTPRQRRGDVRARRR
jgi:hypothetical protein